MISARSRVVDRTFRTSDEGDPRERNVPSTLERFPGAMSSAAAWLHQSSGQRPSRSNLLHPTRCLRWWAARGSNLEPAEIRSTALVAVRHLAEPAAACADESAALRSAANVQGLLSSISRGKARDIPGRGY